MKNESNRDMLDIFIKSRSLGNVQSSEFGFCFVP